MGPRVAQSSPLRVQRPPDVLGSLQQSPSNSLMVAASPVKDTTTRVQISLWIPKKSKNRTVKSPLSEHVFDRLTTYRTFPSLTHPIAY